MKLLLGLGSLRVAPEVRRRTNTANTTQATTLTTHLNKPY